MPRLDPITMLNAFVAPRLGRAAGQPVNPRSADVAPPSGPPLAELRETAAGLYRHAPYGLIAQGLVALTMMVALDLAYPDQPSWQWLALYLCVLALRGAEVLRHRSTERPPPPPVLIRHYAIGVGASAATLAALPWLVLPSLQSVAAVAIVLIGAVALAVVGASLALPLRLVAFVHVAAAFGPFGLRLLLTDDGGYRMLGAVTLMLLVAVLIATALARTQWLKSRALVRENALLQAENIEHTHKANTLHQARNAAQAAAAGLEQRIIDGTAALELRSRELAHASVTDGLTSLPNRMGINGYLGALLEGGEASSAKGQVAVLFLDLEHIKEINDLLGHAAGDEVLRVTAERLRECIPRGSFAARWGGDEFVVVLPSLKNADQQVQAVAEQVRAALSNSVTIDERQMRVGCSIGIALAPQHGRSPEALLIAASHAVRVAKVKGSGRVRIYDASLAEQAGRQHQLAQALPTAVELGQLQVAYQPIVSSIDESPSHVEALVRWRHPQWGAVSPGEFIPVAESSGLILPMGRLVLRQACLDASRWGGANPPKVSVNVSAMQVTSGQLVAQVREALAASGLPAQRLVIELTESMPMTGRERVDATLRELHEMGVTLAIDDFGTGYSSLSALMRQPLTLLKIDRSFVMDVPGQGEVLINAAVDVARRFGLKVVAEGVETRAQQARLITLGVHYLQGYLFGRPMPNLEFAVWLALRDGSEQTIALRETV